MLSDLISVHECTKLNHQNNRLLNKNKNCSGKIQLKTKLGKQVILALARNQGKLRGPIEGWSKFLQKVVTINKGQLGDFTWGFFLIRMNDDGISNFDTGFYLDDVCVGEKEYAHGNQLSTIEKRRNYSWRQNYPNICDNS